MPTEIDLKAPSAKSYFTVSNPDGTTGLGSRPAMPAEKAVESRDPLEALKESVHHGQGNQQKVRAQWQSQKAKKTDDADKTSPETALTTAQEGQSPSQAAANATFPAAQGQPGRTSMASPQPENDPARDKADKASDGAKGDAADPEAPTNNSNEAIRTDGEGENEAKELEHARIMADLSSRERNNQIWSKITEMADTESQRSARQIHIWEKV